MFELHPRLQQDCIVLGRFPLCLLLLMNDSHYPWFILVPERAEAREIFQLSELDQLQLMRESSALAQAISEVFQADKINIAAIGNLVPQLHVHHVARYRDDIAWPKPIWGYAEAVPYDAAGIAAVKSRLEPALGDSYTAQP
ncbi:HIT domain-containing protein [Methylogaea oryzae]|uniref:Histidine triad (HIT) protein n=1 Tax=Methylogaea oryzae TaxID=1295382 RepID=A0A8D5AKS8_9GAMM|nr:HIT domain-containing protein [Methylogaea oryzae]BBL71446.1 histidine triad (HIT) protein [Methylogaea oryzae]